MFSGLQYLNGILDLFDDLVLDAGLAKDVVWGDAGLTTVSVLSPGDASIREWKSRQEGVRKEQLQYEGDWMKNMLNEKNI